MGDHLDQGLKEVGQDAPPSLLHLYVFLSFFVPSFLFSFLNLI